MNYLQTERLEDYWIATPGLHNISGMFLKKEVRRLVSQLLDWKNITIQSSEALKKGDLINIRRAMETNEECTWFAAEACLLLLSNTGYFNPTRTNINLVSLNIPNNEIYQHLNKMFFKLQFRKGLKS